MMLRVPRLLFGGLLVGISAHGWSARFSACLAAGGAGLRLRASASTPPTKMPTRRKKRDAR